MRYGKSWKRLVAVFPWACGGAFLITAVIVFLIAPDLSRRSSESLAAEIFQRYVRNPIPESVTDIRADQPKSFGGYGYVLRFAINRADLDLIVKSRPFRTARIVSSSDRTLLLAWKAPSSSASASPFAGGFNVYQPRQRKPRWFGLTAWEDPETYAVDVAGAKDKDPDKEILIYNGQLGQAYFIVFDYGRDAMWR